MTNVLALFAIGDVLSKILYIFYALLILMFMITIHELGHYLIGKALGFKITEFAIGMGPKLFKTVNSKTGEIFSLRCVPLGGFCSFVGEDEENKDNPDAFNNQPPFKRLLVLFSGAFFNFVSAILIAIIAFTCFGEDVVQIAQIELDSPNYAASDSIKEGDIILQINGETIYLVSDVSEMIAEADNTMSVTVFRPYDATSVTSLKDGVQGQIITLSNVVKDKYLSVDEDGAQQERFGLGIRINANQGGKIKHDFFPSIGRSFAYCCKVGTVVLKAFGELITGVADFDTIGGPITTIGLTSEIAATGFANVLYLITLISVNLAVFNLLPIPALDGSRMVFVIIEWLRGKPVNRNVEAMIHFIGIILLLAFVVIIDVAKLF